MFLFNLSGVLASYEGTCIGQYSAHKVGDSYVYKYIRCFNITTQQSLMLDILYRKINVNQMKIQDTNDYFVANGLDDILQEIGRQLENGFEGKILSILGDSISTFEGYVPTSDGYNLEHRTTYPSSNLLTDVADTWWHRLINNLGMKLGVNDSWSGTRVSNSSTTDTGSVGPKTHIASMTRISNLGANGTPDLILFYGGTNDIRGNVTLGSFDSTATHTTVDLTSETYLDFATAYKTAIQRLMYMYPKAKIVVILPMVATRDYTIGSLDKYIEVIKNICDYFGVYYIDLRRCGINYFNANEYLPDGLHPNANGMNLMERHIRQQLLSLYSLEIGDTITYNVTNNLSNVVSDNISEGV
jgi:lysophospholipase L1-like esterase